MACKEGSSAGTRHAPLKKSRAEFDHLILDSEWAVELGQVSCRRVNVPAIIVAQTPQEQG